MSVTHTTPFITHDIKYINDLESTGSLLIGTSLTGSIITYSTDGDILTISGTGSNNGIASLAVNITPVIPPYANFIFRARTGSGLSSTGKSQLVLWSGSRAFNTFDITDYKMTALTGSTIGGIDPGHYLAADYTATDYRTVLTNESSGYIDKIEFRLAGLTSNTGSGQFDFVIIHRRNIPLRYINSSASLTLKKRIVELQAPKREQGILQQIKSESPVLNLEGIVITDEEFSAQDYRDMIFDLYREGKYQWLYTDFIEQKFKPEQLELTQYPSQLNYYGFRLGLREFSVISADSGSAVFRT